MILALDTHVCVTSSCVGRTVSSSCGQTPDTPRPPHTNANRGYVNFRSQAMTIFKLVDRDTGDESVEYDPQMVFQRACPSCIHLKVWGVWGPEGWSSSWCFRPGWIQRVTRFCLSGLLLRDKLQGCAQVLLQMTHGRGGCYFAHAYMPAGRTVNS